MVELYALGPNFEGLWSYGIIQVKDPLSLLLIELQSRALTESRTSLPNDLGKFKEVVVKNPSSRPGLSLGIPSLQGSPRVIFNTFTSFETPLISTPQADSLFLSYAAATENWIPGFVDTLLAKYIYCGMSIWKSLS
jgi:hypothetical protein